MENNNPQNHVIIRVYPILSQSYPQPQSTRRISDPAEKDYGVLMHKSFLYYIIILLSAIWLRTYLSDSHSLPVLRVNNASLSNFNVSSTELRSSNWEFDLFIRNHDNMFTFYYEQINGSVFYGDKLVAQNLLPPFHQKKKTNNNVTFFFSMDSSVYIDEAARREIVRDRNNSVVSFDLRMSILERHNKFGIYKGTKVINVLCEDIKFQFSSNSTSSSDGIMLGGSNECQVSNRDAGDERWRFKNFFLKGVL